MAFHKKAVFLQKKYRNMKRINKLAGLALIIAGTLALAATRISALASSNGLLLTGLLLIVAGIVVHIYSIKHEGKY